MARRIHLRWLLMSMALVLAFGAGSTHADWAQFLGPNRDGVAANEKGLARTWPGERPIVLWDVELGGGFGGPAIFEGSVLILDRQTEPDEVLPGEREPTDFVPRDVVRRLSMRDGTEIWRYAYEAPGRVQFPGSRCTPATDGKMVYTIGAFGHVKALRFKNGELVWEKHFMKDWRAPGAYWRIGQSPLLLNDMVIFAPWGPEAAVVALDKTTGKEKWRSPNPDEKTQEYSSVVPMVLDDRQTVVAIAAKAEYVIGVDAATGKRLWTFSGEYKTSNHIPSPTVLEGNRVLITGGYKSGAVMFKLVKDGEEYRPEVLWKNQNIGSQIAQPLVYKGHVYANSDDTRGGLRCLTFDGQVKWDSADGKQRFGKGNLLIADGLVVIVNGRTGELVMAEAAPEAYKELGRKKLLHGPQVWGPLAISNGELVLRDDKHLFCVSLNTY